MDQKKLVESKLQYNKELLEELQKKQIELEKQISRLKIKVSKQEHYLSNSSVSTESR